jgi:hypothetical protein
VDELVPLWQDLPAWRRAWEGVGGALVWGVVCGLLLAVSTPLYLAATVVAILGGVFAGAQHTRVRDSLVRGLVGGTLFGLAILAGFELTGGEEPVLELPDPRIAFLVFTVGPAVPLHLIGWRLRRRSGEPAQAA